MNDNIIFEDVFEAIRYLEPSDPVLNLKDRQSGYLTRNLYFNLIEMPDGSIGAFPPNMFIRYFRGENEDYDKLYPCVPSIFRVKSLEEAGNNGQRKEELIIIDELKLIDFELILRKFPQVDYATKDYCKVDYRALAQHYGLNTNLLDVTSDIATAAFFATSYYDSEKDEYLVKEDGVGCLRVYLNIVIEYNDNQPFRLIGLQPFQRPGLQCAFAVRMSQAENFANFTNKILFKQDAKWNQKLYEIFYSNGKNILFPDEEISDVAKIIKETKEISVFAVDKYCSENQTPKQQVAELLQEYGFTIVEHLSYKLSRQQRRRLEREYKSRPYGDVQIRSRLMYST